MKLPCWIKHDWGMYDTPYDGVYEVIYRYDGLRPIEHWKERRYFQDRRCNKCGIIDTTCIKVVRLSEGE